MTMKQAAAAYVLFLFALSSRSVLGEWPCPAAEDIAPCDCTVDPDTSEMDMDCTNIENDDQLRNIFQANFPFQNMRALRIVRTDIYSGIEVIEQGTFGMITFEEIYISKSHLQQIVPHAFDSMNETLVRLQIQDSEITQFPFENIPNLLHLRTLQLANNKISTMSDLVSNTLTSIDLRNNEGIFFGDNVFIQAPKLATINLRNVGVQHLPPDLFVSQIHANNIDLSHNGLTFLETDDFHFQDKSCKKLSLNDNNIASIDPDTFRGLHDDFVLNLENNQITDLPEKVFGSAFETAVLGTAANEQIRLKGNPLLCGCNLKWLILNDLYMAELKGDTACEDGQLVSEVNKDIINANCP